MEERSAPPPAPLRSKDGPSDGGASIRRARALAFAWELTALGLFLLARAQSGGVQAEMISLAWLVAGLHVWRGLCFLGRAPLPPLWLLPLEALAFAGWLDPGAGPSSLDELWRWRGLPREAGTQPLWCLLAALGVLGSTLQRAFAARQVWVPALSRVRWLGAPSAWAPRLLGVALLASLALGLAGSEGAPWARGDLRGVRAREANSWRTGASHQVLEGRGVGVWARLRGAPASALTLRYRSEGLLEPRVRVRALGARGARLVQEASLYGTSPGVVRRFLDLEGVAWRSGEVLEVELLARNDPRFQGTLELAPGVRVETRFAARVEREGWFGAWLLSPLAPLGLGLLLLWSISVWDLWSPGPRWLLAGLTCWACSTWLTFEVPAARVFVGWLVLGPTALLLCLQGWLTLLPFVEALPPVLVFGPTLRAVMEGQCGALFGDGYVSRGAQPEKLERLAEGLAPFAGVPLAVLALGVCLLALGLVVSARRSGEASTGSRVSTWFFALGALGYVLHPTWHLPLGDASQRSLGLLLTGGLVVFWRVLRWLEDRFPAEESGPRRRLLDPAAALFVGLYVLVRLPDVLLPGTLNTDEYALRTYSETPLASLVGADLGWGPRLAALLIAGATLVGLRWAARRVPQFASALVGVLTLVLVAWVLWIPVPEGWDPMWTFRYPPLAKLLPGTLAWSCGSSLAANRLWCLVACAGGGYAGFLGARRLGVGRAAALAALLCFLASNLTWYWSVFAYNTHFLVLFSALAWVPLLDWIRSGRPRLLGWCALWVALACTSRLTGVVSFLAASSAILLTLVASPRHRSRGNAWALGLFLFSLLPGILLWHKALVGAWFGWVGRPLSWFQVREILATYDRWRLTPFSVENMNGAWFLILLAGGIGSVLLGDRRGRGRILSILVLWVVLATAIPLLLGRGPVWDGHPRFILPAILPLSLLVALGLDSAARRWGRWAPLALVLPLLFAGRAPVVDPPAVIPTDLNPWVQYRGRSHGFFPEAQVLASLPSGVDPSQLVVVHEAIVETKLAQADFEGFKSLAAVERQMRAQGWRAFVIPHAEDPLLNDTLYRFQRTTPTMDPLLWRDSRAIEESARFRLAAKVSYHGVDWRVFVLRP